MKTLTLLIISSFLLSSCNDWLDVKPEMQVDREELYQSEEGFQSALMGCYAKLKRGTLYGGSMTIGTIEYFAQHWQGNEYYDAYRAFDYNNDAVKGSLQSIYQDMYNTIAQTNDLMAYLEKNKNVISDTNTYNLLRGEALAIRAFCHFDLLRLFGQIPQNPTQLVQLPYAEVASIEAVPYYSYEEFLQKVLSDYDEAERLLSYSDPILQYSFDELDDATLIEDGSITNAFEANRRARFNYWAVKALKARTYLYIGDDESKQLAYQYAREVIDAQLNGVPVIELAGANDLTQGYYSFPSETIMGLHIFDFDRLEANFRGSNALSAGTSRQAILADVFDNQSSHNRYQLWTELIINSTIRTTLRKFWLTTSLDGETLEENERPDYLKLMPLIRLSEVYLIAMECSPDLTTANNLMRTYRTAHNSFGSDYSNTKVSGTKLAYDYTLSKKKVIINLHCDTQ